jgi:uncharacterized protein (TIGR02145 family)
MGIFNLFKKNMASTSIANPTREAITDVDGNTYNTVLIGNQLWLAENLRVTKFNDGTTIPRVLEDAKWSRRSTPAYCYSGKATSKGTAGVLYNWFAVDSKRLSPKGWHVPSIQEWNALSDYLIQNGYNWDGSKEEYRFAKSLAAQAAWKNCSDNGTIGADLSRNNSSGFTALPIKSRGFRLSEGADDHACFWSSTNYDGQNANYVSLFYDSIALSNSYEYMDCGFSVRLLKD